jgi:hypothetical protein
MKKQVVILFALMIGSSAIAFAQPGGRMSVEERVALAHNKFDSAFKLETAKLALTDSAFAQYYRGQAAKLAELMGSGERPDREAMAAALKPLADKRDEQIKAVLTEAQYKIWKDELEASLNTRRGGRPRQ